MPIAQKEVAGRVHGSGTTNSEVAIRHKKEETRRMLKSFGSGMAAVMALGLLAYPGVNIHVQITDTAARQEVLQKNMETKVWPAKTLKGKLVAVDKLEQQANTLEMRMEKKYDNLMSEAKKAAKHGDIPVAAYKLGEACTYSFRLGDQQKIAQTWEHYSELLQEHIWKQELGSSTGRSHVTSVKDFKTYVGSTGKRIREIR